MLGREAYQDPFALAGWELALYGTAEPRRSAPRCVDACAHRRQLAEGTPLRAITRHMLGLFNGQPGARAWRRHLSEAAHRATPARRSCSKRWPRVDPTRPAPRRIDALAGLAGYRSAASRRSTTMELSELIERSRGDEWNPLLQGQSRARFRRFDNLAAGMTARGNSATWPSLSREDVLAVSSWSTRTAPRPPSGEHPADERAPARLPSLSRGRGYDGRSNRLEGDLQRSAARRGGTAWLSVPHHTTRTCATKNSLAGRALAVVVLPHTNWPLLRYAR